MERPGSTGLTNPNVPIWGVQTRHHSLVTHYRELPEGLWFAVPLRTDGFGVGVIARSSEAVLLGYFFGAKQAEPPMLAEVTRLRAEDAVMVGRFGDLGLQDGTWPVIGIAEDWDRVRWPTPVFVRYEELTGRSLHVFYDDNDPNRVVRDEPVPAGLAEQRPKDGLLGAGAVEILLTHLLDT